jgi:peptidoglycan/LPS O-acetylase OafA/YrhL
MTGAPMTNEQTDTHAAPRLLYVDALRGLAALVVLFHHTTTQFPDLYRAMGQTAPFWHRVLMFVSDRNHDAVLLFFVLSGFSVRLSTGRSGLQTRSDIDRYLYRRFKRILPLFVIALALTAVLGIMTGRIGDAAYGPWTLLGNLAFLQSSSNTRGNWFAPYGANGPLWSLSFEMFYYLLYPAMLFAAARLGQTSRPRLFAAAVVLTVLGLALYTAAPAPPFAFLSLFAIWYCGADLAEQYLAGDRDANWTIATCVIAAAGLLAAMPWIPSATVQSWAAGGAIYAAWRSYLSMPQRRPTTHAPPRAVLSAPLASFGFISYAVYLFHYPMLTAAAVLFGQTWSVLALTAGLSLVLAWIAELCAAQPRYAFLQLHYFSRHPAATGRRAS